MHDIVYVGKVRGDLLKLELTYNSYYLSQFGDGTGTLNVNRVKYAYQRPVFLQLFTDDEIQVRSI